MKTWRPKHVLLVTGDNEELSTYLSEKRPDLFLRSRSFEEVDEADILWADTYLGARTPDSIDLSSVKWVHSTFAGIEGFLAGRDWPTHTLLTRTTGKFGERIGEYCLARALFDVQRMAELQRAQYARDWEAVHVRSLRKCRVLVVGTGAVGTGVAHVFAVNGCIVDGVSLRGRHLPPFSKVYPTDKLTEAVAHADFIVITVPLTAETKNLFNQAVFKACQGAFLINVGRGQTVEESALLEALDEGWIRGCALDVFQTEPLPADSPLWHRPNVLVTPHMAALTLVEEAGDSFLTCLAELEAGILPRLAVNLERGY